MYDLLSTRSHTMSIVQFTLWRNLASWRGSKSCLARELSQTLRQVPCRYCGASSSYAS
jgi:hypothetical protein